MLPVNELLASTVTSVVTASESFLFLFGNPGGSETLCFLDCPETLLLCFAFQPSLDLSFVFLFFLLASSSLTFFFSFLYFCFHFFSSSCCFFLFSLSCYILKHLALVSNVTFGLDRFDRLTRVTCGVCSTNIGPEEVILIWSIKI